MGYWDQFEPQRREGFRPSKAFENLQQILGTTAGIAQSVQRGREQRGTSLQYHMNSIIGRGGINFRSLYDNTQVEEVKQRLLSLGDRIKISDIDTQETYQYILGEIDQHKLDNTRFTQDKLNIEKTEEELYKLFDDFYADQKLKGVPEVEALAKNIKSKLNKYKEQYTSYTAYFKERLEYDPDLVNTMLSVKRIGEYMEDELLEKNAWFDEGEYAAIMEARKRDSYEPIKNYLTGKALVNEGDKQSLKNVVDRQKNNYEFMEQISKSLFPEYSQGLNLSIDDVNKANLHFQNQIIAYQDTQDPVSGGKINQANFEEYYSDYLRRNGEPNNPLPDTDANKIESWQGFLNDAPYGPGELERHKNKAIMADNKYKDKNNGIGALTPSFYSKVGQVQASSQYPATTRTLVQNSFNDINNDTYPGLSVVKNNSKVKSVDALHLSVKDEYNRLIGLGNMTGAGTLQREWSTFYDEIDNKIKLDPNASAVGMTGLPHFYKNVNKVLR